MVMSIIVVIMVISVYSEFRGKISPCTTNVGIPGTPSHCPERQLLPTFFYAISGLCRQHQNPKKKGKTASESKCSK